MQNEEISTDIKEEEIAKMIEMKNNLLENIKDISK